jgi:hypothetical protein
MSKFESKLSAFGKQRLAATATQLRPIVNPRRRHISIAWITTPVAAFAGIMIGIGIQWNTNFNMIGNIGAQDAQTKMIKAVTPLSEFCYIDSESTIELPELEIVINPINKKL